MSSTAEYNYEDFQPTQQAKQDESLLVKFFTRSVQDKDQSEESGRPVFREKEYIGITVPGSRDGTTRPATHRDRQRFPRHYAAFKQRTEIPSEGTPLIEWGPLSRSMADQYAFLNVKTVEDLSTLSDTHASQMMNGLTFKQKAIDWLERVKEDVTTAKLEKELAVRDHELNDLRQQVEELRGMVNANKPKRTRKRADEPSGSGGGAGPDVGPV